MTFTPVRRVLLVLFLVACMPALLGLKPAHAAFASYNYEQVVDITFPLKPSDGPYAYSSLGAGDFHAARGGGSRHHRAHDIWAPIGAPVYAAMGGTISFITGLTSALPSYGWMIEIQGDDGRSYHYIHLGTQNGSVSQAYASGLARGSRVERGQHIGFNGCSGNANCSFPHLHFEIHQTGVNDPYAYEDDSRRINPYYSLKAAENRGDYPGATPPCTPDGSASGGPVDRVGGANRIATAVEVSRQYWAGGSTHAVVATARNHADALAGAALAAKHGAPLLLTNADALPSAVRTELTRLGAQTVWVLGGNAAVAPSVESAIRSAGIHDVRRLPGADRFHTAALVAQEVGSDGEVALALGHDTARAAAWPDAVAAGALAALDRPVPTLLTRQDRLPEATLDALRALDPDRVLVAGGQQAVSSTVVGALEGVEVERLSGSNRYATSVKVVEAALERRSGPAGPLVLASGKSFPDGLSAGALASRLNGSMLLVPSCGLEDAEAAADFLDAHGGAFSGGVIVGGTAAVSDRVKAQLNTLLGP